MEKDLGLELFVRERQRIRLTESGRWLLDQAQTLLTHAEKIRASAGQRCRGEIGTLSIAFTSAAMWSRLLPNALKRFQTDLPNAQVELQNMRSPNQLDAVRSGRVDVGFVSGDPLAHDLECVCVAEEPSVLVLPASNRLAAKDCISPRDLHRERWILLAESVASAKSGRFFAECQKAGFAPQLVQTAAEPITLLALVESGLGIGLIRSSAANFAPPSLMFKPLPWFSFTARTYMVRPMSGRQPLSEAFVQLFNT